MAYSDAKTQFLGILNRRDITTTLVNTFMQQAIQRIQRNLRVPAMEKVASITMDGINPLLVPGDLLELISITAASPSTKLIGSTYETVNQLGLTAGVPTHFYRSGGTYLVGPLPVAGQVLTITYYADANVLSADADTNWITAIAQDMLVYGALSYAADYYLDQRRTVFEDRFIGIMNDIQGMANMELLTGGATIDPFYDMSEEI